MRLLPFGVSLLVLAACSPGAPVPDEPRQPNPPADTGLGDTLADTASWGEVVGGRFLAEEAAFYPVPGGFRALQPLAGLEAAIGEGGAVLRVGDDRVGLRTRSVGRDGAGDAPTWSAPQLGDCVASGEVDLEENCIARVELEAAGVREWWASVPGRVQVGWEVEDRPAGRGPLEVVLALDGAAGEVSDDGATAVLQATDHSITLDGLTAWDETGASLPAWWELRGADLVVLVDDSEASGTVSIDPYTITAGRTWSGSASSYFGRTVSSAGDVNLDGYDDVIVGSPMYSSNTGRAFVYNGSASGVSSSASTTLAGLATNTYFGRSVSTAGDVNLDGFDDVIVGADGTTTNTGAAYVYYGSATGLASTSSVTLTGPSTDSYFGAAVADAGDIDGDGYGDVIVGAYGAGGSTTGAAYVYHGAATGLSSTVRATLTGTAALSSFGAVVHRAGDVNGDGFGDVLVGAYQYSSNTGYVSIYHGSASGLSTTAARTLTGTGTGTYFGISANTAGDVDDDGYDDVVIGASGYSSFYGRAQVFHGSASGVAATATTSITGPSSCYFGYAVAGDVDLDADGYDDIVVGGYVYSSSSGLVRTYRGSSTGISTSYDGTITGSSASCLGAAVAGLGDTNGDGYGDIVAGGYCSSSNAGTASVFYGQADVDGDGYYVGSGVSTSSKDCNDADSAVHPGATELVDDGVDQNCDNSETCYDDDDNDGFLDTTGDTRSSSDLDCADNNEGQSTDLTTDCDDSDSGDRPGATETIGNGDDENCDGAETCYDDDDNDGYLDTTADTRASTDTDCSDAYEGTSSDSTTDCNDADATVRPGLSETVDDGIDQNCDNQESCYDDDDNDGYLDTTGDTRTSTDLDCADTYEGLRTDPTTDCDDNSASDYPGATETPDNADDEDCDGKDSCYDDDDDDGYLDATGDLRVTADNDCLDAYEGRASDLTTDCNDADATIKPGATEGTGDEVDQNCDNLETCYNDGDDDGYTVASPTTVASTDTDCDDAYEAASTDPHTDCDDSSATVNPGATEVVGNGVDETCDNVETCFDDDDNDGYLDTSADTRASLDTDCTDAFEGQRTDPTTDCDDTTATIYPGATDTTGDEIDSDCDGREVCYTDGDGDDWAIALTLTSTDTLCSGGGEASAAQLAAGTDCDDADATVYPGAAEAPGDEVDSDCDGGEDCYGDADVDGYSAGSTLASADSDCTDVGEITATAYAAAQDCDDFDDERNPGEPEMCDDADLDEDCDLVADDDDPSALGLSMSVFWADADGDGFGDAASPLTRCDQPVGYVDNDDDCDDGDVSVYPGAPDTVGDAGDQDCDGVELCYVDSDHDGWAVSTSTSSTDADCTDAGEASAAVLALGADCDDGDAAIHPAATEVCDARDTDEDCDGRADDDDSSVDTATRSTWYADADGDTYGDVASPLDRCDVPTGYGTDATDCDDTQAQVHPGATEGVGDELDSDCDGTEQCYADLDRDGWGGLGTVPSPDVSCADAGEMSAEGFAAGVDCDDSDAAVNPAATEVCDDEDVDEDCNGLSDDQDPDVTGQLTLYVDADADLYGSTATSLFACDPTDGYSPADGDCNDGDAAIFPGAVELCNDVDDDCDAGVDEDAVDAPTWYPDADGDGYGGSLGVADCDLPDAYVTNADDCDEDDPAVHPGAEELCNELDDDCDGESDPEALCGEVVADPGGCGCSTPDAGAGALAAGLALGLLAARRRTR